MKPGKFQIPQLISFDVKNNLWLTSPQKRTNKFVFLSWQRRNTWNLKSKFKFQVFPRHQDRKTNLFICFLGEFTAHQFCFEIYWPLENPKNNRGFLVRIVNKSKVWFNQKLGGGWEKRHEWCSLMHFWFSRRPSWASMTSSEIDIYSSAQLHTLQYF